MRLARQFARPDVDALEKRKEIPSGHDSYQRILNMLRTRSGLELRQYKQETISSPIVCILRFWTILAWCPH